MSAMPQLSPEALQMLCPKGMSERGVANIAVVVVVLALALLAVGVRLFVRKHVTRALWWDDVALVVALLFYIPTTAITITEGHIGLGKHIYCLQLPEVSRILRLGLVVEVMLSICIVFPRLAIALLILRVFCVSRLSKVVLYSYSAFMVVAMCSTAGTLSAVCTPRAKFWSPWIPGVCWSTPKIHAVGYLNGSVGIFSDIFLAVLPMFFLKDMQMSLKKKIGLSILMGLGVLIGVFAVMRTYYFPKLLHPDVTYDAAPLLIFTNLECGVAIIVAAIPALWPLISRHIKSSKRSPGVSPEQVSPPQNGPSGTQGSKESKRFWHLPVFTFEGKSRPLSSMGWTLQGFEKMGDESYITKTTTLTTSVDNRSRTQGTDMQRGDDAFDAQARRERFG